MSGEGDVTGASVRAACAADFPAICDLVNHYILNTAVHFGTSPETPIGLRDAWERSLPRFPFVVAEVAGQFAGFAKAYRWRDRRAYDWTAEVGVYVVDRFQRRGVARALYGGLIQACREQGLHSLIGGVALPNEASERLHEALGFVHVGTVRHAGWKRAAWHDVAFYQLILGGDSPPPE